MFLSISINKFMVMKKKEVIGKFNYSNANLKQYADNML